MTTITVQAHNVRNAVAEARRHLNLDFKKTREVTRNAMEEGNSYRVTLADKTVVEVCLKKHAVATVLNCECHPAVDRGAA